MGTGTSFEIDKEYPLHTDFKKIELLFVGALGVKHNLDALRWFSKQFYPTLKPILKQDLGVTIAGSSPTATVTELCRSFGWTLRPDLSEQDLARLYKASTFSILPFRYSTGVKLKLLETFAFGVPCLASEVLSDDVGTLRYPSLASNDPLEWLRRIQQIHKDGISRSQRQSLATRAAGRSWKSVAHDLFDSLRARDFAVQ
jgi:glycosyltransferase involved in cell wall biosynthesis